jgi:hypothetical protein
MVVNSGNCRVLFTKIPGQPAEGLMERHVADDDWLALTQCRRKADARPWTSAVDLVHRSTVDRSKGYAPLLTWAVRANRTAPAACGRGRRGGGRPAVAPGGACRRGSSAMAKSATRAPNSTGRAPGGGGEDGEAYQGLGGAGRAPAE